MFPKVTLTTSIWSDPSAMIQAVRSGLYSTGTRTVNVLPLQVWVTDPQTDRLNARPYGHAACVVEIAHSNRLSHSRHFVQASFAWASRKTEGRVKFRNA